MRGTPYWLAVDIGASSVKVALWDAHRLRRMDRTDFGSTAADGDWIARQLRSKLASWGDPPIRSAVAGVPALVDSRHRTVLVSFNLGWFDYPLASILSKALAIPVSLETDILLAARAEAEVGAGRNSTDFVYMNLGTGISHVRMLNMQPQMGAHGLAANVGHAPLFSGGDWRVHRRCSCGRPYCVESVLGGRVVAAALRSRSGHKRRGFWRKYGANLGITLSCMASLLDPECFVLNGGVCVSRAFFEPSMRAAFREHTVDVGALPKIYFSRLGDRAGLIGAGLAAQRMRDA